MARFACSIFLVLAFLAFAAPAGIAQNAAPAAPAAAEPLGENEPLPFMHSEKADAPEEPSSAGLLLKTIASMAFIIGLIFVGAWGAKKLGYGSSTPGSSDDSTQLQVLRSVSVGSGRTVSAIRFGSRVVLVGSTAQSFTLLAEENGENGPEQMQPRSVAEMLAEDTPAFNTELKNAESRLTGLFPGGKAI